MTNSIHLRTSVVTRTAHAAAALMLAFGLSVAAPGQSSRSGGSAGSRSSGSGGSSGSAGPQSESSSMGSGSDATRSSGASTVGSAATASTETSADTRRFIQKAAKSGLKEVRLARLAAERATDPAVRDYAQMLLADHQQANVQLTSIARTRGIAVVSSSTTGSTGTHAAAGGTASTSTAPSRERTDRDTASTSRGIEGGQAGTQTSSGGMSAQTPGSGVDADTSEAMRDIDQDAKKLAEKSGAAFDRAYIEKMIKDHKDDIELFEDAGKRAGDSEVSGFAQATLPKLRAHLSRAESLEHQVKH